MEMAGTVTSGQDLARHLLYHRDLVLLQRLLQSSTLSRHQKSTVVEDRMRVMFSGSYCAQLTFSVFSRVDQSLGITVATQLLQGRM